MDTSVLIQRFQMLLRLIHLADERLRLASQKRLSCTGPDNLVGPFTVYLVGDFALEGIWNEARAFGVMDGIRSPADPHDSNFPKTEQKVGFDGMARIFSNQLYGIAGSSRMARPSIAGLSWGDTRHVCVPCVTARDPARPVRRRWCGTPARSKRESARDSRWLRRSSRSRPGWNRKMRLGADVS
jgi:hypothetical protein